MSNIFVKGMYLLFKFRDLFLPPKKILKEVDIQPGFHVLDYGCGSGSYSIPASELVGESGKVYALDIHPLAVETVQKRTSKKWITNIETICSDCATGLKEESIDILLLYDVFHIFEEPNEVLAELHRILKPNSILSFSDHHMKEDEILPEVTNTGLFKLLKKGKWTYSFTKVG